MPPTETCSACYKRPTSFDKREHEDGCPVADLARARQVLRDVLDAADGFYGDAPLEEGEERDLAFAKLNNAIHEIRVFLMPDQYGRGNLADLLK